MKITETTTSKVQIVESDRSKLPEAVLCRVVYPICNIGELNANNRMYERAVWENVLADEGIVGKMQGRVLFGQAEHPAETQSDLQLTSHTIFETWIDEKDNRVYQKMDILDTPTGRIVDTLLRAGCQVGVSTRAEGDLEEYEMSEGKTCQRVIPESYRYVTTDFTADPSTFNVEPVALQRNVVPTLRREMKSKEGGSLARLLYESIQPKEKDVDEGHTSVSVTTDIGNSVTVEADGEVGTTTTADGAVTVTPEAPLGPPMEEVPEPDNTGLGMPAVEPEEEELPPMEEPEEEEMPFESKVNESPLSAEDVKVLFVSIDPAFAQHLTGMYGDRAQIVQAGLEVGLELSDQGRTYIDEEPTSAEMHDPGVDRPYESTTYKDMVDLQIKEASIRAERDTLLENAGSISDADVQIRILADRLSEIQGASTAEIVGLRRVLERKAQEAGIAKQKLSEAVANRKTEADMHVIHTAHQEELVKTANESKRQGCLEIVREYFDRRLAGNGLQVDENSRALLERCQSLGDVDILLERLIGVARRSALHSTPLKEVTVRNVSPKDPEQQKVDEQVGVLFKHMS